MTPRNDAGFTLIEVLIAMFIFALISVGATLALTSSLRGKAQMNTRISAMQDIDMARTLLRSDFAHLQLRTVRDAYGGPMPYVLSGGVDDLITFTRSGRTNPGGLEARSEFQRVTYVFEDGNLIRRSLNQLNPAPQTESRDRILLRGLQSVDMTFQVRRNAQADPARVETANTYPKDTIFIVANQESDMPTMVTLNLTFENGDSLEQYFELAI